MAGTFAILQPNSTFGCSDTFRIALRLEKVTLTYLCLKVIFLKTYIGAFEKLETNWWHIKVQIPIRNECIWHSSSELQLRKFFQAKIFFSLHSGRFKASIEPIKQKWFSKKIYNGVYPQEAIGNGCNIFMKEINEKPWKTKFSCSSFYLLRLKS